MLPDQKKQPQEPSIKIWLGLIFVYLLVPVALILSARDFFWWQAWIYSVVVFIAGVGGRALAEMAHPGLMMERTKYKGAIGVKKWDKILAPLVSISISFPLYIVAGLDHLNRWSPDFPFFVEIIGLALCIAGYGIAIWALVENKFFTSTVRIQADRGHTVCDTGPYRIVRHPGYAGNVLAMAGIILLLESYWTIIPALIALILIIIRTELEDRMLKEELQGYRVYANRVRYKFFPGVY